MPRFTPLSIGLLALLAVSGYGQVESKATKRRESHVVKQPLTEFVAELSPSTSPDLVAAAYNVEYVGRFASNPQLHVFRERDGVTRAMMAGVRSWQGVRRVVANPVLRRELCAFTPNDPYYPKDAPTSGWPGQWYLHNSIGAPHAGIVGAWAQNWTGAGVTIGILDNGFELGHPDLMANALFANSYDFVDNDTNVNPSDPDAFHGTAIAGIISARGNNATGITGVAPYSRFVGLRVDPHFGTAASFADATLYRSSGESKSIHIKTHAYAGVDPFVTSTIESEALTTSTMDGTMHVVSAGNNRGDHAQDANKLALQSTPDAIVVAGVGSDGKFAQYSSFGANVFCSAPTNSGSLLGITTTDLTGDERGLNGLDVFPNADYTNEMTGTSVSAALVSGALALAKHKNPDLNVRFAKHLIARTAKPTDLSDATTSGDGGWKTNDSGIRFNPNYGFGVIDAEGLINGLGDYVGVTPQTTETKSSRITNDPLPDNDPNGVSETFVVSSQMPIEDIQVTLDITHPVRGDVAAYLTSPKGTTARLFSSGDDFEANINWTFVSNAFWGENPSGVWTLKVCDLAELDEGVWNSFAVRLRMGRLIATDKPSGVAVSPSNVTGSLPATGRVMFAGPARVGGAYVQLSSSNTSAARVPSNLTAPEGSTNAEFAVTTFPVSVATPVTISATRLGVTVTTILTVKPPVPINLTFSPSTVMGGENGTGTVTLNGPAPALGATVFLISMNSIAVVPDFVQVAGGQTVGSFEIVTQPTGTLTGVRIEASHGGGMRAGTLNVNRAVLSGLTINPTTVTGGNNASATVTLNGQAPLGGANVMVSTNNPVVTAPETVKIGSSQTSRIFALQTAPVATSTNVIVTVSRAGLTRAAAMTVARPVLSSFSVAPRTLGGGETGQGLVTLTGPAPVGGITIGVTRTGTVLSVPESMVVEEGSRTGTFEIGSSPVSVATSGVVTVSYSGASKSYTVGIQPTTVRSIAATPNTLLSGQTTSVNVTLSVVAPAGGANVALRSNSPYFVLPSAVLVPAGLTSKMLSVTAGLVGSSTTVTITAIRGGVTVTNTVTINP